MAMVVVVVAWFLLGKASTFEEVGKNERSNTLKVARLTKTNRRRILHSFAGHNERLERNNAT